MRRKLQAKLNSKKGFTLVELLIVVAIIAILVAISIPMVTGSLERARVATDQANERAARAAAVVEYLTDGGIEGGTYTMHYYDAENGVMKTDKTGIEPYGQCKTHKGGILAVSINNDTVKVQWMDSGNSEMGTIHGVDNSVSE